MIIAVPILPVLVSALVPIFLGYIWYHPKVFGKIYSELAGDFGNTSGAEKPNMKKLIAIHFLLSVLISYVLASLIIFLIIVGIFPAIKIAFLIWLAFIAATAVIENIYNPKPKSLKLLAVQLGYHLVSLVLMAILLALWL